MAQNGSKRHAAQPDLEDLQSDPRQHTCSKNVRDATGTKPGQSTGYGYGFGISGCVSGY
ncbi:TPA: hypothetical protein ACH3X1_014420 [Trebouxia sp. C0004]